MLQAFGSELSDTELPDEANAIEFLLHSHSHRYRQMKVCPSSCSPVSAAGPHLFFLFVCFFSGRHPEGAERRSPAAHQPGDRQGFQEGRGGGEGPAGRHGHRPKVPFDPSRRLTWERVSRSASSRLLGQLRDMEEAFDGFFEKHHLKLQQYLQLLQYEISFQQVWWPRPQPGRSVSLQPLCVCASRWRRC